MRKCALIGGWMLLLVWSGAFGWQWPLAGPFEMVGDPDFALRFVVDDPAAFRLVAPGEAIYLQADPLGEAGPVRKLPREIYRHGNGIWSVVEREPDSDAVIYRLYDARLDRFVNPRVLLPLEHEGPFEALPEIAYRQSGAIRNPGALVPGELEIVSPPAGWNSATIPLEISILHEGRVIAMHRFVYADDIASILEADGTLRLAAMELRPGVNAIEIQTRRYDGSPRLRRYDIRARTPVLAGP